MKKYRISASGIIVLAMATVLAVPAFADREVQSIKQAPGKQRHDKSQPAKPPKDYRLDDRYRHDHYYPRPGANIKTLPSRHYRVPYKDSYFYFSAGIWYRPYGSYFIVSRPPIGIIVPVLPPFYTTVWFYGVPYYYANDVYYVWRPDLNAYIVTEPPAQTAADPVPLAEQLYIYPARGQSEQQQADDRYACHRWGVEQTSYDPTQPPQGLSLDELNNKRENYQRAMRACLEGRGYTVR